MKNILVLLLCLGLSGCATNPYIRDKTGQRFGFSDYRVSDDVFIVSFRGRVRCSYEMVSKFVLRRASEIALENNFTHFVILEKADDTKHGALMTSSGSATAYGYGSTATAYGSGLGLAIPFSLPALSFKIKYFKGKPSGEYVEIIDAEQFLNYNFPDWKKEFNKKEAKDE